MTWHDVIVVGGGPGGSTAAWKLASVGLQPLVLEAKAFPRVKLCTGWVTPPVWTDLELSPNAYPHTIQPFSQVRLTEHGHTTESRWPGTVGYGIIRSEFDQYLLERAVAHGARAVHGIRVNQIEPCPGGLRLICDNREYLTRVVIGAGGTHCPVGRHFAPKSDNTLVVAQEAETCLGAAQLRSWTPHFGVPELIAEPDFMGYGWYFAKGDYLNLGVGAMRSGLSLRERLARFQQYLVQIGRLPGDTVLEPFRGHSYYVDLHAAPLAGERFVLVGDAAGLARPISGEGIGPAIYSGRLAAEAVANHLREDTPLRAYAERLRGDATARSRDWLGSIAAWCPEGLLRGMARTVCRVAPLRKRLLFEGCFGMRLQVPA